MTALVIGTNLAQDWLVSGLQLIYCFLYYYLLVHLDENRMSAGRLVGNRRTLIYCELQGHNENPPLKSA